MGTPIFDNKKNTKSNITFNGNLKNTDTRTVLIGNEIEKYNELVSALMSTKVKKNDVFI